MQNRVVLKNKTELIKTIEGAPNDILWVISALSGTGKNWLVEYLLQEMYKVSQEVAALQKGDRALDMDCCLGQNTEDSNETIHFNNRQKKIIEIAKHSEDEEKAL